MVLETTIYGSITLGNFLIISGLIIGLGAAYLFLQKDEWVRKFNQFLDTGVEKAGAGKDKAYNEEELRSKLMQALENDDQQRSEIEKEMTMNHVMREVEAIQSQAKALGRQEERMKGEDSDAVYNMVFINVALTGLLAIMFIWINFM